MLYDDAKERYAQQENDYNRLATCYNALKDVGGNLPKKLYSFKKIKSKLYKNILFQKISKNKLKENCVFNKQTNKMRFCIKIEIFASHGIFYQKWKLLSKMDFVKNRIFYKKLNYCKKMDFLSKNGNFC